MCRPVPCKTCGRTTWTGCGEHVEQVRRSVPPEQWCPGHGARTTPPAPPAATPGGRVGRFFRL